MAEFEEINFDDSKIIAGIQNIKKNIEELGKVNADVSDDLKKSMEALGTGVNDVEKDLEALKKEMTDYLANAKKSKEATEKMNEGVKELVGDVKVLGVNLSQTVNHLKNKATALKSVVQGVNATSKSLNIFKIALISTGIGAIVVLLGSLVAWLAKSQKGIDLVSKVMAGLGAAISVITDRLVKIGGAIVKVFQGDFKGAFKDAGDAVSGLTAEMNKEIRAAVELEGRIQKLRDAHRDLAVDAANSRLKIKQLNLVVEDTTKSIKDRLAAAEEAGTIERGLLDKKLAQEKEQLAILEEQAALKDELSQAEKDEIADQKIKLAEIETESLDLQTNIQNKKNNLLDAEAAKVKALVEANKELRKELEGQVKEFVDAADKIRREELDPVAKIKAEEELAIKLVELQTKQLKEKAKKAGVEIDIEDDKEKIIQRIQLDSQRKQLEALGKFTDEFSKLRKAELDKAVELTTLRVKAAEDALKRKNQTEKDIGNIEPVIAPPLDLNSFEILRGKIQLALGFGTDEEGNKQFQEFASAIQSTFSSIFDGLTARIGKQLEENQVWIDDIKAKQDELADLIDKEKERKEKGLANNLDVRERELEALKLMEAQALKEQQELKKKAATAQLIQDSAAQVSNLVTAASGIIEGFSKVPILGIALGIAAVASMFAFFASAKSKAKDSVTRSFEGGHLKDILGANASTEDEPHRGRGTYIHPNVIANANEYLLNGDSTLANLAFMKDMNSHKYDNVDLARHMALYPPDEISDSFGKRQARMAGYQTQAAARVIREAVSSSFGFFASQIVGAINSKPDRVAWGPGQKIRTYDANGGKSDIEPA